MKATIRHRGISALAALAVVGGGGLLLVLGLALELPPAAPRRAIEAILPSRSEPAPPPAPTAPSPSPTPERGGSAPAPGSNTAPLILPPPVFPSPVFPPLVQAPPVPAARNPGSGTAAAGAGGEDGAGGGAGGGGGNGAGGGSGRGSGAGDYSAYPRQVAGKLHYWEIPKELRRARAGVIRLRYRIGTDGRVSECTVIASSGLPEFDRETCARLTARFRFRPARDAQGRSVPFVMTETHGWDYEPASE